MQSPEGLTRVEIYDQLYQIKGGIETEYVKQLAAYVDSKMREIAQGSKTVDSLKVAVLAALNIADELFRCQDVQQARRGALAERTEALERLVDAALAT